MKNIILPIILCLLTITTISANTKVVHNKISLENIVDKPTFFDLIKKGDYKAVKASLESGQKVEELSNGLTPLMFAARYNRHKIAKLLIGYGADTKAISTNGKYTPLKMARLSNAKETYYVIKSAIDKKAKSLNSTSA